MMKKTKKLALSAILSAFGVVILFLGALVDVLDMSTAILASFLVLFCMAEMGYAYASAVYLLTALLGLLLLPNKAPALLFAALFGYVPVTKFLFERIGKWLSWLPKLVVFNGIAVPLGLFGRELLVLTGENSFGIAPEWMLAAYLVLANIVFVLCDVLYTRLMFVYLNKYRDKIRKYLR